jgi:ubiquinone/menaquinone biosynthesis C-methylase UbiE
VVAVLQRWGLVERHRTILQIGCGIGRMEQLLAPTVRDAYGIDISPNMIATARRRCEAIPNAHFLECSGRDLALFEDGSFDLVYAVDSFPYLCQAGMPLVEVHLREIHRVLRSRGDLAIFNFSYRGDPAGDRRDVARLASDFGYDVIIHGDTPFALWDGLAFHLRRSI